MFDQKHLPGRAKRALQKVTHALAVPVLDMLRYGRQALYEPETLEPEVQVQLRGTLLRLNGKVD
jgi:hypothetical protein